MFRERQKVQPPIPNTVAELAELLNNNDNYAKCLEDGNTDFFAMEMTNMSYLSVLGQESKYNS